MKYEVWSAVVSEEKEIQPRDQLETTRTDKKVAEDYAQLINERLSPL